MARIGIQSTTTTATGLNSDSDQRPLLLFEQVRSIAAQLRTPKDAPVIAIIVSAERALGIPAEGPLIARTARCFKAMFVSEGDATVLDSVARSSSGTARGFPIRRSDTFATDMIASRTEAKKEWPGYQSGAASARSKLFVSGPDGTMRLSASSTTTPDKKALTRGASCSWEQSSCRNNSLARIGDLDLVLIV